MPARWHAAPAFSVEAARSEMRAAKIARVAGAALRVPRADVSNALFVARYAACLLSARLL